jgi:NADH dehydrogenase
LRQAADYRRPRVVIIGAGFGGLWAARSLAGADVDTILIDRNNFHTFLPLLYQVAAAEVEPEEIVYPIRSILQSMRGVEFCMGDVTSIDLNARMVKTTYLAIPYDFLVLAAGSASNFFGIEGAAEYSMPLKTMDQGINLRNHILSMFERAMQEPDAELRRRALTFTIVGGGPTGVEYAGALSELILRPLKKDYKKLDFSEVRVILLEAADNLLQGLPEKLGTYALKRLRNMKVDVRLGTTVEKVTPESVHLKSGDTIPTETVIWTAGVRGEPLAQALGFPIARSGRVAVLPTLQIPDHPEVYVIGDLAYSEEDGKPRAMVAPVAIQQGTRAAKNILRQLRGGEPLPFRYKDPGTMATIGRNAAVAYVKSHAFTGFPAWLLWVVIHIYNLIGFRNRIFVLINWALDYFFYQRTVRLIFP